MLVRLYWYHVCLSGLFSWNIAQGLFYFKTRPPRGQISTVTAKNLLFFDVTEDNGEQNVV